MLSEGRIIAIPTETTYGFAVDMHQKKAVKALFDLKKRDLSKPFVLQFSSSSQVSKYLDFIPYDLEKLTHKFWPGPLTLVLPVQEKLIPSIIRSNLPTAGFRVPHCVHARTLIETYGPLVVTSANRSKQEPFVSPQEIEAEFGEIFLF